MENWNQKERDVNEGGVESSVGGDEPRAQGCSQQNRKFQNFSGKFLTHCSKLEFPQFFGHDLRTWLYKVDQFFAVDEVPPNQMTRVALIHLDGDVTAWHRSYMRVGIATNNPSWSEYVLAINNRFGDSFEEPMKFGVNLSDENCLSCYLGGLKSELNKAVRIHTPRTLHQAYKITRFQEEVFKTQVQSMGFKIPGLLPTPKPFFQPRTSTNTPIVNKNVGHNQVTSQMVYQNIVSKFLGRRLSTIEMNEKRAKGLCFFCDEPYIQGHNCRIKKGIYMEEVLKDEDISEISDGDVVQELLNKLENSMPISLQSFTGVFGYQTIKVTGYHEKKTLQVLIGTVSTHNFIDKFVATRLGYQADLIVEQSISIADGRKV